MGMRGKVFALFLLIFVCVVFFWLFLFDKEETEVLEDTEEKQTVNKFIVMVIKKDNNVLTVQDNDNIIYSFFLEGDIELGDNVQFEYEGKLDKNKELQDIEINNYEVLESKNNTSKILLDNGILKKYYEKAYKTLINMSLDEKIAQILLVRYPESNGVDTLKKYQFGGYVFFARDFKNKSVDEVKMMMSDLQNVSKVPILTAVDEEGGKVVRISSNPNLANEPFKSSRELYLEGGFEAIKEDTINKSKLLFGLGINLNLAPVVDVSVNSNDYMYSRALGEDSLVTSEYAREVIKASKGLGVSYTLKHFPGYGNNTDTHSGEAIDNRSYEDILKNDLPPFEAGIDEGAEAVLVSHNIVNSIDSNNPASLSTNIHNLLRNKLKFSGIIITDDLAMGATENIDGATLKAILSGNDLIITTDYEKSINSVKEAISNKVIDESLIDRLASRVIAWKYYKKML